MNNLLIKYIRDKVTSFVRFTLGHGVARIISGSMVNQILGLVLSLALPYLLCESDFGAIRVVTAYMAVVLMAGGFCLPPATASYIGRKNLAKDKSCYGVNGLYLGFIASLLVGISMAIICLRCNLFNSQTVKIAFISRSAILFLAVLMIINLRALQAFGRIKEVAKLTASIGAARLIMVAPLSKFFGIYGWMIGMGLSDLVLFLLTMFAVKPYLNFCWPQWKEIRDLLRFSVIQVVSGVIAMMAGNLDLMALERVNTDLASIGYYGLAVMFFKQASLPAEAFGVANFSRIGEICHDLIKLKSVLIKIFIRMLAVISAVVICILVLVPIFIRLVYPSSYEASIPILRLLCIGLPFLAIWVLLSQVNIAIGKPSFEVLMSVTGLIFMIAGLYIFLLRNNMGLIGAAWSLNICYCSGAIVGSALLISYLFKKKIYKK